MQKGKPGKMMTTLCVDTSAVAGQTRVVKAVCEQYVPLKPMLPRGQFEAIVGSLIVELRALLFRYNVTTIAADGTSKTVVTLRYRGNIKDFTAAFWARELHYIHN